MLAFSEIVDAAEGLLKERFPGEAYYREHAPTDFVRPSFLTELGPTEMADASYGCLEVQVGIKITAFAMVDEYYDTSAEELMRRMAAVQELFSVEGLRVGDRVLHVTANKGSCQLDYAEVSVTLKYQDNRPTNGKDWPLMEQVEVRTNIKGGI